MLILFTIELKFLIVADKFPLVYLVELVDLG